MIHIQAGRRSAMLVMWAVATVATAPSLSAQHILWDNFGVPHI